MGAGASTGAPALDIDVSKWSKEQVAEKVAGLGNAFEAYKEAVLDNDIDGKTLVILTSKDLEEVGMTKGLHRKKVLAKVEELSSNQATIKSTDAKLAATIAVNSATQGNDKKLFLSYARGDESTPFARRLKAFLEEYGFEVWMDEESIAGGADFMSAIGELRIQRPAHFISCLLAPTDSLESAHLHCMQAMRSRIPTVSWR